MIAKALGLKRTLKKPSLKDGKKRGSKKKLVAKSPTGGAGDTDPRKGVGSQGGEDGEEKGPDEKKGSLSAEEEQILVLNLLFHFLFVELKDTPRLRQ